jgi:hypothetical protein
MRANQRLSIYTESGTPPMRRAGASRLRRWARRAPAPASRLGLDLGRHRPDIDQYGREVHLRRRDDRLVRASLLEATLRRWQETGHFARRNLLRRLRLCLDQEGGVAAPDGTLQRLQHGVGVVVRTVDEEGLAVASEADGARAAHDLSLVGGRRKVRSDAPAWSSAAMVLPRGLPVRAAGQEHGRSILGCGRSHGHARSSSSTLSMPASFTAAPGPSTHARCVRKPEPRQERPTVQVRVG